MVVAGVTKLVMIAVVTGVLVSFDVDVLLPLLLSLVATFCDRELCCC